jgi:DNA polymerase III subunit epsilon
MSSRLVVLDTETTGLEPKEGHRIIEIGCVELIDRRLTGNRYHQYIQPDRDIDEGAIEVHGISNEFLADKPRFAEIYQDFLAFVKDSQLVIHNAAFDVGFINHEFSQLKPAPKSLETYCEIIDSLALARRLHPGQKNNLDALCTRYHVDNTHRELHGALLDAEILAQVYLAMTGGQVSLSLAGDESDSLSGEERIRKITSSRPAGIVVRADADELLAHQDQLAFIEKSAGKLMSWSD